MENTIYIITSGEYSEYGIVSVWTDEEEANKICKLYNARKDMVDYRVEPYAVNSVSSSEVAGWVATYDCKKHGYSVDVNNVVIEETLLTKFDLGRSHFTWQEVATAKAETIERAQKILFDLVAKEGAEKFGLA